MSRASLKTSVVVVMAASLTLLATGCSTPVPATSAHPSNDDASVRLMSLLAQDRRVTAVGYRLLAANVALCHHRRANAGWALQSASQYSGALRPIAEARFGLDGDLPGVSAVAPTGPAARADVHEGDLITAVNGIPLKRGPESSSPSHDGLADNIAVLDQALAQGPVTLSIRRDGAVRDITLQPATVCTSKFQVDPSTEYNARADGRGVYISSRLVAYAADDDELALILGHELAHNVLQHRPAPPPIGNPGPAPATALAPGDRATGERDADRVGLYLAARAGYDPNVAPGFWRRFAVTNWRVRYAQIGHASAAVRARALEVVNQEIAAKRASGQPLIP